MSRSFPYCGRGAALLAAVLMIAPDHAPATELPGTGANGLFVTVNPYARGDSCNLATITGMVGGQTVPTWPANLDGVTFLMEWSDLETVTASDGAVFTESGGQAIVCPNGDRRQANLAQALALIPPGVHLGLAIKAGQHTPPGLMAPPGTPASTPGPFASVDSMLFSEPPTCVQEPIFWETSFIQAYFTMMHELASFLTSQGRLGDLKLVQLSGMDDNSAETFVPTSLSKQIVHKTMCDGNHPLTALDGSQVKPGSTPNNQLWLNEGYVAQQGMATFQSIAAGIAQIFPAPDMLFSVAVINNNGMPDDNVMVGPKPLTSQADFTRMLVGGLVGPQGEAAPVIPASNVAMSWQGLNVCEPRPVPGSAAASRCKSVHGSSTPQLVCQAAGGAAVPAETANVYNQTLIAWQTNTSAMGSAGCGKPGANVSCSGDNYAGLVENGVNNGARFIEIWPEDVVQFGGYEGGRNDKDYISMIHNFWLNKSQSATCYYSDGAG